MANSGVRSVMMIVAAGILWGVIGLFSRALNDAGLSSYQVTESRCFITAAGVLLFLAVYDRRLLRIDPRDLWMFAGMGVLSIVLFNVLYFETAQLVSLSMTAVLLYTAPCFVLVFSVLLFKEALTARKVLALAMAFAGCVLTAGLVGGDGAFSMKGFLMGLGSGLSYSLYSIFGKYALKKYHPFTVTFYTFLVASLSIMPFCDPWRIVEVSVEVDGAIWYVLGLGIVITLLPYFLYTCGLRGLDAGVASVIAFVEPMVATIAGFVVYGEAVTIPSLLGIFMILSSIILLNIGGREDAPPASDAGV